MGWIVVFLITWTTYGYWLPGDPRGFRTYRGRRAVAPPARYAAANEKPYDPEEYKNLHRYAKSRTGNPVTLNESQMKVAAGVIAGVAGSLGRNGIVAVLPNHVHVLVELPETGTTGFFCNRVKSRSSLRLSDHGLKGKVWARRYHAKRIPEQGRGGAGKYVKSHTNQGAIVISF
jgi:hypothetical protein